MDNRKLKKRERKRKENSKNKTSPVLEKRAVFLRSNIENLRDCVRWDKLITKLSFYLIITFSQAFIFTTV